MRLHLLNPKKRGNAVRLVPSAVITVLKARARNYFALEIVKNVMDQGLPDFGLVQSYQIGKNIGTK
jgi:hypothetical protein